MSRGVVSAARRRSAQRHADRVHTCPVCDARIRGNGGWSSHKRAHVRAGDGHPAWVRRYRRDVPG